MAVGFAPNKIVAAHAFPSKPAHCLITSYDEAYAPSQNPSPNQRLPREVTGEGPEDMMERITMYHNPACGNSRGVLEMLRARDVEFDIVEYLKDHPTRERLEKIIEMLDGPVADLVRKDKRFKELGLNPGDYTDRKSVV